MSRDSASLLDIAEAARLIAEFTQGMDQTAFRQDIKTQKAVIHEIMVLGEAVKRISRSFRDQHPNIPWSEVAAMCDKLIHGYDAVDLGEVWQVVETDAPHLLAQIEPLLPTPAPNSTP